MEGLLLRVEKERTKPVLAGSQARGEREGHGFGGQDVKRAPLDEGGDLEVGEQLVHSCRYVLGPFTARRPGTCRHEAEQVRPLDVVELQDALQLLAEGPTPREILVKGVLMHRWAERDGTYDEPCRAAFPGVDRVSRPHGLTPRCGWRPSAGQPGYVGPGRPALSAGAVAGPVRPAG